MLQIAAIVIAILGLCGVVSIQVVCIMTLISEAAIIIWESIKRYRS